MIPNQFIFMEKLPLTINGKTDKSALSRITEKTDKENDKEIIKILMEIWNNVFDNIDNIEDIIHANLSESFLDSVFICFFVKNPYSNTRLSKPNPKPMSFPTGGLNGS